MEVKVAAVEAHRRLPSCEKSRNQFFLNNYRNFTIDTELRIASYLQIMRCPDYNIVKIIRHTLEKEEVNQGSNSFQISKITLLLNLEKYFYFFLLFFYSILIFYYFIKSI
jgi:hypothetical protein